MLPDKNELNDELIEQISGGEGISASDDVGTATVKVKTRSIFVCSNCGSSYEADQERTDGYCPNCEPQIKETIAPIGDIKTFVPNLSDKKKLIKAH